MNEWFDVSSIIFGWDEDTNAPLPFGREPTRGALYVQTELDQPLTDEQLRATPVPVVVQSETLVKKTFPVSAAGDTPIYVPANGKKLRLYFFGYSAGAGVTGVLASLKLEGYNGDAAFDSQYLVAPGQPYARNIQGGKRYVEGAAGDVGGTTGRLILNLTAAQAVYANFELEEV